MLEVLEALHKTGTLLGLDCSLLFLDDMLEPGTVVGRGKYSNEEVRAPAIIEGLKRALRLSMLLLCSVDWKGCPAGEILGTVPIGEVPIEVGPGASVFGLCFNAS